MKKQIILYSIFFQLTFLFAQTSTNYSIKGEYIHGNILRHTKHLQNLVKDPVQGAEIAIEWQTMGEKPWHQYYDFPRLGISLVGLDLGNPEMLGQLLGIYPYLNFKFLDLNFLKLSFKGGAGMSFLNKRFNNTATDLNNLNTGNAAIGSIINVYFAGGFNMEIPVVSGFSLMAGYNWNHASNGSFYQPNSGINMLNANVGLKFNPHYKLGIKPERRDMNPFLKFLLFELIASVVYANCTTEMIKCFRLVR